MIVRIFFGDFSTETSNTFMEPVCRSYNPKSLIKKRTCFKSITSQPCIDLILTNDPKYFETNRSGLQKLKFTVTKSYSVNQKPRIYQIQKLQKNE